METESKASNRPIKSRAEERDDPAIEHLGGDMVKEVVGVGFHRGGHRLEVGPGCLFNEAVADAYLASGRCGGGGGVGCAASAGDKVLEGGVRGDFLDRERIEVGVGG